MYNIFDKGNEAVVKSKKVHKSQSDWAWRLNSCIYVQKLIQVYMEDLCTLHTKVCKL